MISQLKEARESSLAVMMAANDDRTNSEARTREFTDHLDEDKSGDIDRHEFCEKINLNNLHKESHLFLISELTFIEKVLSEWYYYKKRE